jgi:hypothetical protein
LAAASLVAVPALAGAQPPASSFEQLAGRLKAGQTVSVTDKAGAEKKGKLLDLSPTALTLTVDGTRHEVPAARISTIKQHQRTSLLKGTLIGLGVGVGMGVVLGLANCGNTIYTQGECASANGLAFGAIGSLVGLGVAAIMPRKTQTVFQAPAASPGLRVMVGPFVVPQRKGVLVRVSF